MAYWYTYKIPEYEEELEQLEEEFEDGYREEELKERELDKYESWLFDQKMDFYEDIGRNPHFLKFQYHLPSAYVEETWCEPDFECSDPMGLFYKFLDKKTFKILRRRIFKMKRTAYVAEGKQHFKKSTLYDLLSFARRWCKIHLLYNENDRNYNYKLTLWVASRILLYLDS